MYILRQILNSHNNFENSITNLEREMIMTFVILAPFTKAMVLIDNIFQRGRNWGYDVYM